MQSNIFCLQETYMSLCMQNEHLENFNCISNFFKHGLDETHQETYNYSQTHEFRQASFRTFLAKVIVHGSQIAIINIRTAPHANSNNILDVIAKDLHHLDLKDIIIILGGFNI